MPAKHAPDIDPMKSPAADRKARRRDIGPKAARQSLQAIAGRWNEVTGQTEIQPMQGPRRIEAIANLIALQSRCELRPKRFVDPETGEVLVNEQSLSTLKAAWPAQTAALLAGKPIRIPVKSELKTGVGRQPFEVVTYEEIGPEGIDVPASEGVNLASLWINFLDITDPTQET